MNCQKLNFELDVVLFIGLFWNQAIFSSFLVSQNYVPSVLQPEVDAKSWCRLVETEIQA